MVSRLLNIRMVALLAALLIVSSAVYGFAAANIVPETGAGDGSNTISGYTITNVTYELEGGVDTDPSTIEEVQFDLAASAGAGQPATVEAQIVDGDAWYSCTTASGASPWTYTCPVSPSVDVSTTDQLRIVAAE